MIALPGMPPLSLKQKYLVTGLLAVAAALFYILRNLYYMAQGGAPHTDIATFYAAAEAVFSGHVSPYSVAVLNVFRPSHLLVIYPFLYPPSALPFFWPLAGHGYETVYAVTTLVNAGLLFVLIVGMALWMVRLTSSFWAGLLIIPVLTEGSRGLWATLWFGQINAVIAILLLGALWALRRERKVFGGLCLGMAITLKVYPAILLPWLALRRDWTTLAATLATLGALALLTWFWLPHYLWGEWLRNVVPYSYGTQPPGLMPAGHMGNLNIHGVLMRSLSDTATIRLLAYASIATLYGFALFTAYKRPGQTTGHFAAFIWLTLLIAPVTWLSHLTYTLFVVVYFLASGWTNRQYLWCAVFAAIYGITLQLTQVSIELPVWRINMPCIGLLLLWLMMYVQLWQRREPAIKA